VRQETIDPLFSVIGPKEENLAACGLRRGTVFGSFIHLIDCETQ
jgi:hypothetical protein